jgi:hypothetical protein
MSLHSIALLNVCNELCRPPTLSALAITNNLFERVDMAFTSRLAGDDALV